GRPRHPGRHREDPPPSRARRAQNAARCAARRGAVIDQRRPSDLEDAERPVQRLLSAIPPRALPLGFRDEVMRHVTARTTLTWEWIAAAVLAVPSLAFLIFQVVDRADEVGAALNNIVAAPASGSATRRPGIFFDPRNSPPPARTIVDAQRSVPDALAPIVPLQRGLSDTARDAAGYLLILLGTSAALVLAHEQVVSTYRAS